MGSSPSRGIQPILSEEYVEREKEKKDAHILICTFPFIATFVFLNYHNICHKMNKPLNLDMQVNSELQA